MSSSYFESCFLLINSPCFQTSTHFRRLFSLCCARSVFISQLSLFSSRRKNWFAARCEYLHLIKKNSQCLFARCEFFLVRCKYSQRAANQFLRWLEKRLKGSQPGQVVRKWISRQSSKPISGDHHVQKYNICVGKMIVENPSAGHNF